MCIRDSKKPLDSCVPVTDKGVLSELIGKTAEIYVADTIYEYIAELVDATRGSEYIQLGVSPRGCLAVCRAAKAWAFISGRILSLIHISCRRKGMGRHFHDRAQSGKRRVSDWNRRGACVVYKRS